MLVLCYRAAPLLTGQPTGTATTATAAAPDRPIFTPRSNPRHLFLRTQLPSTESASAVSPSAATPPSTSKQAPQQQPRQQQDDEAGPSYQDKGKGPAQAQHAHQWKERQQEEEMQEEEEDEEQANLSDNQVLFHVQLTLCNCSDVVVMPSCISCTYNANIMGLC